MRKNKSANVFSLVHKSSTIWFDEFFEEKKKMVLTKTPHIYDISFQSDSSCRPPLQLVDVVLAPSGKGGGPRELFCCCYR